MTHDATAGKEKLKAGDYVHVHGRVDRVKGDGTVVIHITGKWQDQFVLVDRTSLAAPLAPSGEAAQYELGYEHDWYDGLEGKHSRYRVAAAPTLEESTGVLKQFAADYEAWIKGEFNDSFTAGLALAQITDKLYSAAKKLK